MWKGVDNKTVIATLPVCSSALHKSGSSQKKKAKSKKVGK